MRETTMRGIRTWCVSLLLLAACMPAAAANRQDISTIRKLAESLVTATMNGDYAFVVDHTYDGVVKELGGRDEAIRVAASSIEELKTSNLKVQTYRVGTPQDIYVEGKYSFTIVPTWLEMFAPDARIVARSYLLGISADGGKTWKFADGSGLDDTTFRERALPKLPADFKLPESEKPIVTRVK
jgi:hypothetical protein